MGVSVIALLRERVLMFSLVTVHAVLGELRASRDHRGRSRLIASSAAVTHCEFSYVVTL